MLDFFKSSSQLLFDTLRSIRPNEFLVLPDDERGTSYIIARTADYNRLVEAYERCKEEAKKNT